MRTRPEVAQPHYGSHLGDVEYWRPYVSEALDRHGLPDVPPETGFVGTFPTFLAGEVVVKFFGALFDGLESFEVERQAHRAVAGTTAIPAPALIASGSLFDDAHPWPYLIQTRARGVAIRDARLSGDEAVTVATELGIAVHALHALPCPSFRPGLLDALRARRPHPHLPPRLHDEVDALLADALPADTFVHGDITADHVFVDNGRLTAIIDWGDALPADPYYELVPIFFDAFARDRSRGDAFLRGYGWPDDPDFERRLVQAIVEFQFNALAGIDLHDVPRLDRLADRIWRAAT